MCHKSCINQLWKSILVLEAGWMFPQPGHIIPDVDVFSYLMIPSEHLLVASTIMIELFLNSQAKRPYFWSVSFPVTTGHLGSTTVKTWAVPGLMLNGQLFPVEEWASLLPGSSPRARIFTLMSKLLTFRSFLRLCCFAWSLKDEMQFTLSLQVSGCETHLVLMTATFAMHRMSKPCNGQWFYISFHASMFKRFIFLVKFSYPFKSANISW